MRLAALLVLLVGCGRIDFSTSAVSIVGCADGEREGLDADTVAACGASWIGPRNMRSPRGGGACGDDRGDCVQPADACAPGWHLCTTDGHFGELLAITGEECGALDGRYVAASTHCEAYGNPCTYAVDGELTCKAGGAGDCIQPICCGTECDPSTGCRDGVWPGLTLAASFVQEGCAELLAASGVLCCRD